MPVLAKVICILWFSFFQKFLKELERCWCKFATLRRHSCSILKQMSANDVYKRYQIFTRILDVRSQDRRLPEMGQIESTWLLTFTKIGFYSALIYLDSTFVWMLQNNLLISDKSIFTPFYTILRSFTLIIFFIHDLAKAATSG